ncbi:MAG: hypothetical protein ACXWQQ_01230 [Pseudobdellovibrio sp.]
MQKFLKQILYYSLPLSLAIFIFVQTIYPAIVKSQNQDAKRFVSSAGAPSKVKVPEYGDLKKAPDGTYYTYKANYSCAVRGQENLVPSYADSFQIKNGQICRLGDACAHVKNECHAIVPTKIQLTPDFENLEFEHVKYKKQNSPIPDSCVMPACGTPPDICEYDEMPPLDAKGCPMGCGTMTCKPIESPECPLLNCAAPPQNCEYDGKAPHDANNCPTGCGNLVCATIRVSKDEFKCPDLKCARPPENCRYDSSAGLDNNGCKTSCGQIVCEHFDPKKTVCPKAPQCAEPPAGCNYVGDPATDKDGCAIGCGSLACKKNYPAACKQPQCAPPTEYCRYDGNAPLDFNGCSTGCGNLICKPPAKKAALTTPSAYPPVSTVQASADTTSTSIASGPENKVDGSQHTESRP